MLRRFLLLLTLVLALFSTGCEKKSDGFDSVSSVPHVLDPRNKEINDPDMTKAVFIFALGIGVWELVKKHKGEQS